MSDDDDLFSLDFTVPGTQDAPVSSAAPVAPVAPVVPKVPANIAPPLELSLEPLQPKKPEAQPEPAPEPEPASAPEPEPEPEPEPKIDPPATPVRPSLPAALEEAATLYAAGQDLDALRRLETALKSNEVAGSYVPQVWAGLFDLLQVIGRRAAFDALAMAYAKRFEKSPPTWVEPAADDNQVYATSGGRAHVAFAGVLNANIGDALKQVMTIARTSSMVRLDLGKLVDANGDGCTLMMRALAALKKAKKEYIFGTPERLAEILAPKLVMGTRGDEAMWLLQLELYQQSFRQDLYEDTAVSYAVTFEVSPPSWEAPKAPAEVEDDVPPAPKSDGFSLRGELSCASRSEFSALEAAVVNRNEFVLDARNLARIDAGSATVLLEILTGLALAGKKISIAGLSVLVATFLESVGFAEVVELRTRAI